MLIYLDLLGVARPVKDALLRGELRERGAEIAERGTHVGDAEPGSLVPVRIDAASSTTLRGVMVGASVLDGARSRAAVA